MLLENNGLLKPPLFVQYYGKEKIQKKQGRVVSEYKLKVCCLDRFAAPAFIIQYYGKRIFKKTREICCVSKLQFDAYKVC